MTRATGLTSQNYLLPQSLLGPSVWSQAPSDLQSHFRQRRWVVVALYRALSVVPPVWIAEEAISRRQASSAGALGILLIGAERVFLSVFIAAVAVGLLIFLHIGVSPRDTVEYPTARVTFVINVLSFSTALFVIVFYAVRQFTRAEERAEREQQRSEDLLVNILPPGIAKRLKERPDVAIADAYPEASVLFADMAGFTARAGNLTPKDLVQFLNRVYTRLDSLVEGHGLEKIKTSGDSYMVVSGVPEPRPDHAARVARLALDMRDALAGLVDPKGDAAPVRIGVASGPVVAGVVGTRTFFYDVWGDTVNMASRMESTGEPGKIQVAPKTRELLADDFEFEERGVIDVRGKGPMRTWFLIGRDAFKNVQDDVVESPSATFGTPDLGVMMSPGS